MFDLGRYPKGMTEVTIQKEKFDKLLRQMLKTTPLPKSEVKVEKAKPKKKRKKSAA